eukprot:6247883-Pyramimonas_sp.AAC.1
MIGTVPGQQLGDAIFNFIMAECMHLAKDQLQHLDLAFKVPTLSEASLAQMMEREPAETQPALDVLFFDDGAFAMIGAPLQLLERVPQIAGT